MSLPEPTLDIHEALERIPALTLLSDEVRKLVEASFEAVAYSLGDEIVREGDPADAFYVLVDGSARVVKRSVTGGEVALNVLHGGDTFGEMALLEDTTRVATVRASGRVEALRLDRHVFSALTRSYPEVRTTFEALANQRALWNFLRVQSSFAKLPNEALALLSSQLERVEVFAGDVVVRQGDPPGPMYVIESGRARSSREGEEDLGYFRTGDFFGERSLLLGEPRAATVEAVTDCVLLRFDPDLFQRLLGEYPEFRERVEQRLRQYDYHRLARVPLDFAEEILPAEASAFETADRAQPSEDGAPAFADALDYEGDGQPARRRIRRFPHIYQLDEMDCGAASLAMVCRYYGRAVSISRVRSVCAHIDRRNEPGRNHEGRRGAGHGGPVGARLEEQARPSCRSRRSCTGRETTGSCFTRSITATCVSPIPPGGSGRSRGMSSRRSGAATPRSSPRPSDSPRCRSRSRASAG